MYCKFCGKEIDDNSDECVYCGSSQHKPTTGQEVGKTVLILVILAVVAVPLSVVIFILMVLGKMWGAGF